MSYVVPYILFIQIYWPSKPIKFYAHASNLKVKLNQFSITTKKVVDIF